MTDKPKENSDEFTTEEKKALVERFKKSKRMAELPREDHATAIALIMVGNKALIEHVQKELRDEAEAKDYYKDFIDEQVAEGVEAVMPTVMRQRRMAEIKKEEAADNDGDDPDKLLN